MHRYSYKVNKRRYFRQFQRQNLKNLLNTTDCHSSSDETSNIDDNNEQLINQEMTEKSKVLFSTIANTDDFSFATSRNYIDDENDWISEDEHEDDDRPIYSGSRITVTAAICSIVNFYLKANLDKEKVNELLRLIKYLLPKPNRLPASWKTMTKSMTGLSKTSTSVLCSDCHSLCTKSSLTNSHKCTNSNCKTSFQQRRSTEIIEIVHLDIRAQIQSIMARNVNLMNKPALFPPSDICFGERYQHSYDTNSNKITLIMHSDGAPLVRSSKKAIWPCFASIVELPPPVRDFQSNIIVLALWVGKDKPDVNIFLQETINDLLLFIRNGTFVFIGAHEYQISLATQFFVSDLPAKALFCRTTYFNGYSACTYCYTRGKFFFLFPSKINNIVLMKVKRFVLNCLSISKSFH